MIWIREVGAAVKVIDMVKQTTALKKAAIVRECAKYTDMVTGKIVRNGIAVIKSKFGISRRSILRYNQEYRCKERNGDLTPDLKMDGILNSQLNLHKAQT